MLRLLAVARPLRGVAAALSVPAPSHAAALTRLPGLAAWPRSFSTESKQQEPISTESLPEEGQKAAKPEAGAAGAASPEAAALKASQEEVAKLKATVQELNSSRLRLLAEMENVRTIAKRDVDTAKVYGIQSFAKAMLNVADNLGRAVEAVPAELRVKKEGNEVLANLYEGVAATERELKKTLGGFGVEPFGAKGDKFDPNKHEAMMQVPASAETPANTVALLLKVGYNFKERTLRPAQVAVATEQ